MLLRCNKTKTLTVILLLGALFALAAAGCAQKGSSGLTFYEFFDPTWPRCINMKPIVNELEKKYNDRMTFELYDITQAENDAIATKYHVYLTPTFVIADQDGKELDRVIGEVPKKTLETVISKNISKSLAKHGTPTK